MNQREPDFWVLEYVTITKAPCTGLVVAIGGTEKAADILQRTGGFLSAPGPRGDYHRLPHGLPVEQQRLTATTASHALLAAGRSVHLDPALNMLATPDGEREAALRYLARLTEQVAAAETSSQVAEVLTEVAASVHGLLPPAREVIVRASIAASDLHGASTGEEPEPIARLGGHRRLPERSCPRHPARPQPRRPRSAAADHRACAGPRPVPGFPPSLTPEKNVWPTSPTSTARTSRSTSRP
ncbi:hypothetical protein ABZZ16_11040 [Streptomyces sp. NPDC006386]|uniref:hypothetical protein n=1 Tax=Streptomyces sp. NPDC006386 TaxID=3156762 RepID=UPI0033A0F6CF